MTYNKAYAEKRWRAWAGIEKEEEKKFRKLRVDEDTMNRRDKILWNRNNGLEKDEILRNQFSKYLEIAVRRRHRDYLRKVYSYKNHELLAEDACGCNDSCSETDMLQGLPLEQQLENEALAAALREIKARERYVFLERVLNDKSFYDLALELGMSYKAVAAVYYRTVLKIKKRMEG